MNWYKRAQQMSDHTQSWIHGMERTFELTDFGRTRFRFLSYASDREGSDIVRFQSSPDPTLPEYGLTVRLSLKRGAIDIHLNNGSPMPIMKRLPVNEQTVVQSPAQIAMAVREMMMQRPQTREEQADQSRSMVNEDKK